MISIEEVTDAASEQQKPMHANEAHIATAAESSDQPAAAFVDSPQTDANAEGAEQQVSGSGEQDTLVRIALFTLVTSRRSTIHTDLSRTTRFIKRVHHSL